MLAEGPSDDNSVDKLWDKLGVHPARMPARNEQNCGVSKTLNGS